MPLFAAEFVPIVAITVQWSIAPGHSAPMGTLSLLPFPRRTRRCTELVEFPMSRWRGRTVAVLLAAAVPFAASAIGGPGGAVGPGAPRDGGQEVPEPQGRGDRPVQAGVSERRARALVRSHHGRVTDRLPSINGFAVKLPAREARALRRSKQVLNLTLNTRVHSTGVDGGSLATTYPKTVGADKLWAAGITGKGVGVAVIDSGIDGDMPDFKNADGSSRITANVIANPGATRPATTSATARTSPASSPATPSTAPPATRRTATTSASPPRPTWSRSRPPTTTATRPCSTSSRRCSSSSTTRPSSTSASSTSR